MKGKIFSPAQATRMLPLVRRIVLDAKACSRLLDRHRRALELEGASTEETEGHQEKIVVLEERLLECEQELESLGITLEDSSQGVVKLYGEIQSEIVFLTWRPGDDEVCHWFPVDKSKTSSDRRHIDELLIQDAGAKG